MLTRVLNFTGKGDQGMHLSNLMERLLLCVFLLGPTTASAALPLITDDTGMQGKGKFQLEASGTWLSDKENEASESESRTSSLATVVFTAGIAETLDLMVTVPYVSTKTNESGRDTRDSGISDTLIEAKWRFYEKQKLSLAIKPGILIPMGNADKGLGTDHVGYSAVLISTVDAEPWSFDANVGYLYLPNSSGARSNIWFGSFASLFAVAERWKIVGEIGASRNTDPGDSIYPVFSQIGLIYSPTDYLDLSAGYQFGLNNAAVDQSVRAGVTVRF